MTIFSVQVSLPLNQHLRIVGSIGELGQWSPFESRPLQLTAEGCQRIWSAEVPTACVGKFFYRFLVCENLPENYSNHFSVIKCGPLKESRGSCNVVDDSLNTEDPTWLDGWLLYETEVHLTIHNADRFPITLLDHCKITASGYRIKVSTMTINLDQEHFLQNSASDSFTKVVGDLYSSICSQDELGIIYDPLKHFTFVSRVLDVNDVVFKIEICALCKEEEEKLRYIGYGFVQPVHLKESCGILDVSLCNNEAPVGVVQVEYLLIKPLSLRSLHNIGDLCDRNWQKGSRPLHMGHRGCGSTFSLSKKGVQENTIESFITAFDKGADGIELDVHATKDLEAVIYHDLDVRVPFRTKDDSRISRIVPVHQLTYQELQQIQVDHTGSPEMNSDLQAVDDINRKIFPTLEEVLKTLPSNIPLELEVKYLETEKGNEDDPFLDVNRYVDIILKTVLENIGDRKVILMSFSPVVVQLMSRKQKKLPVKLGLCGETDKYPVYRDIRIRTVEMAVGFAHCERILGVSSFCDPVLASAGIVDQVKERGLVLSTWGEENNKEDVRERQRQMGVNVICYDAIHEALST